MVIVSYSLDVNSTFLFNENAESTETPYISHNINNVYDSCMQQVSNKGPAVEHQVQGDGGFNFAWQRLRKFCQRAGGAKEHMQIVPFRVLLPIERR